MIDAAKIPLETAAAMGPEEFEQVLKSKQNPRLALLLLLADLVKAGMIGPEERHDVSRLSDQLLRERVQELLRKVRSDGAVPPPMEEAPPPMEEAPVEAAIIAPDPDPAPTPPPAPAKSRKARAAGAVATSAAPPPAPVGAPAPEVSVVHTQEFATLASNAATAASQASAVQGKVDILLKASARIEGAIESEETGITTSIEELEAHVKRLDHNIRVQNRMLLRIATAMLGVEPDDFEHECAKEAGTVT